MDHHFDDPTQQEIWATLRALNKQLANGAETVNPGNLTGGENAAEQGNYLNWGDIYLDYGFNDTTVTEYRRDLNLSKGKADPQLVDRLVAHMAVEVAIGAFGRAERPVDIEAEAPGAPVLAGDGRAGACVRQSSPRPARRRPGRGG